MVLIRTIDLFCSIIALIFLLPLCVIIGVVLRLSGEGEVFYLQDRVGLCGKNFKLIKFATMLKDSPNIGTGTITLANDARVLPVGRFLRKSKLNEIPQLLNVIKGDMSLIGPRPQTAYCFSAFPEIAQGEIVKVVPGLSGLGSLLFHNEESWMTNAENSETLYFEQIMPFKGKLEAWFVANVSLKVYLALILLTLYSFFADAREITYKILKGLPEWPADLALSGDSSVSPR